MFWDQLRTARWTWTGGINGDADGSGYREDVLGIKLGGDAVMYGVPTPYGVVWCTLWCGVVWWRLGEICKVRASEGGRRQEGLVEFAAVQFEICVTGRRRRALSHDDETVFNWTAAR
jgi:hypothetical protein